MRLGMWGWRPAPQCIAAGALVGQAARQRRPRSGCMLSERCHPLAQAAGRLLPFLRRALLRLLLAARPACCIRPHAAPVTPSTHPATTHTRTHDRRASQEYDVQRVKSMILSGHRDHAVRAPAGQQWLWDIVANGRSGIDVDKVGARWPAVVATGACSRSAACQSCAPPGWGRRGGSPHGHAIVSHNHKTCMSAVQCQQPHPTPTLYLPSLPHLHPTQTHTRSSTT